MSADNSKAAVTHRLDIIEPKKVVERPYKPYVESRTIEESLQDGSSVKDIVLSWVPWIISTTVMGVAVLAYFIVNPLPIEEAFTESVLAIIVFGAGGAGGSMTFNRLYKYKVTNPPS